MQNLEEIKTNIDNIKYELGQIQKLAVEQIGLESSKEDVYPDVEDARFKYLGLLAGHVEYQLAMCGLLETTVECLRQLNKEVGVVG